MSSKEHGVNVIDFIKVVDFNLPVLKTGGFPPPPLFPKHPERHQL